MPTWMIVCFQFAVITLSAIVIAFPVPLFLLLLIIISGFPAILLDDKYDKVELLDALRTVCRLE